MGATAGVAAWDKTSAIALPETLLLDAVDLVPVGVALTVQPILRHGRLYRVLVLVRVDDAGRRLAAGATLAPDRVELGTGSVCAGTASPLLPNHYLTSLDVHLPRLLDLTQVLLRFLEQSFAGVSVAPSRELTSCLQTAPHYALDWQHRGLLILCCDQGRLLAKHGL